MELASYKQDIGKAFVYCVNILNVARSFDKLSFEMELLAKNGAIQACKVNSAQGKPLIVLAEDLAKLPLEIHPEIETLEQQCTDLCRKVAICSIAIRRYYQYSRTLLQSFKDLGDSPKSLEAQMVHHSSTFAQLDHWLNERFALKHTPMGKENEQLLLQKCRTNLDQAAKLLGEAVGLLSSSSRRLERIRNVGLTAKYVGLSISVNVTELAGENVRFNNLVNNINQMVIQLNQKYQSLMDDIERSSRMLGKLAVQTKGA